MEEKTIKLLWRNTLNLYSATIAGSPWSQKINNEMENFETGDMVAIGQVAKFDPWTCVGEYIGEAYDPELGKVHVILNLRNEKVRWANCQILKILPDSVHNI